MIKMRNLLSLALAAGAALSLTAPAFASDYSFTTKAPQDYYNSTSYEDVYGSQYNYGGRNMVDYDIPELEYGRPSTTQTGVMERTILPGLQQVVASSSQAAYPSLPADAESSLIPLLLLSPQSLEGGFVGTPYGADGYGLGGGGGGPITELIEDTGGGSSSPGVSVIPDNPQITVPSTPAYTSVEGMAYKDGTMGSHQIGSP